MRDGARKITTCAVLLALMVVGGFIKIPIGTVPITLQTLFVLLAGGIGGWRMGATVTTLYIAMGLMGIPIFSGGGGITYVTYPTFGYLLGFVPATMISGVFKKGLINRVVSNFIGVAVIHLIGVGYLCLLYNGTGNLWEIFLTGSLIFLPIDILSAVISAFVANKIYPIIIK